MKTIWLQMLLVMLLISSAGAQPLADHVPARAVAYLGWRGNASMPAGYDQTHLKAILDNSKLREFFTQFLPQVIARANGGRGPTMANIALVEHLLDVLVANPTCFYFDGIDMSKPELPIPRLAILCQAGKESTVLAQQLTAFLARETEVPLIIQDMNGLLVMELGYASAANAVSAPQTSLAQSADFQEAMKQLPGDPMIVAFGSVDRSLAMIESLLVDAPPSAKEIVPSILNASGLRGVKNVSFTAGFDGKDWLSQCFINAPAPRSGLVQLLDPSPISPELMKSIPADSTFAGSVHFDTARFFSLLREVVGKVDPQAQMMYDRGMGAVQVALAKNLVDDLLAPMGTDWAMYCSPSVAGEEVLGVVLVNHLDDPAKAKASLPTAAVNLCNWINIALRGNQVNVQVAVRTMEIDGMTIYYLGTPLVAPAWTIKDDNLYVALYPQNVAAAARWGARHEKSMADSDKLAALQKRLNVPKPSSFGFLDLPESARHGGMYQQMLMVGRIGGFGDLFGVQLPEPLFPPFDFLQQHLTPAGSFAWVDDAGYHAKGISPFPASELFGQQGGQMIAAVPMVGVMAGILLPSLNRARETANRVKCAANLKSIGQAMLLYANENRGKYPATLGELIIKEDITPEVFVCPSGNNSVPPEVRGGKPEEMAAWTNENADYIYMVPGKQVGALTGQDIVVYEKPGNHEGIGINLLYGDGHVEWRPIDEAMRQIELQTPAGAK